jgi:RNA polymerase-binding transcription factor DksA
MPRAAKQAGKKSAKKAAAKKTAAKKTAAKKTATRKATAKKAAPAKKAAARKTTAKQTAAKKAAPKKAASKAAAKAPAKVAKLPAKAPAKPAAPAPRKAARAHDAKFLAEQKAVLLAEREDYERQAEAFRQEAEQLAAEMGPGDSQFDEETGGEGDAMSIERERDLAMSAQARAAIDEIDRALAKIVTGTYGICERCHQPIMKARLKALPYASLCVQCKSGGLSSRR